MWFKLLSWLSNLTDSGRLAFTEADAKVAIAVAKTFSLDRNFFNLVSLRLIQCWTRNSAKIGISAN